MASKKQQRAAAKKQQLVKQQIASKRKAMGRRTVSNRALDGEATCPMKIVVFLANNNCWYLSKKSNLSHLHHPPLDSAAKLRSEKDLSESDRTLVRDNPTCSILFDLHLVLIKLSSIITLC
jgi:hypothetical protein